MAAVAIPAPLTPMIMSSSLIAAAPRSPWQVGLYPTPAPPAPATSAPTILCSTPLTGILQSGQYFLVQEAQGAGGSVNLPTPDITDLTPISLSATGAKLALVSSITSLGGNGGSTPIPPANLALIVDLVGWGGANYFEGAGAAPATSNTTALFRLGGGLVDTDNNAADFVTGAPTPRNSTSPFNPVAPVPAQHYPSPGGWPWPSGFI